MWWKLCIFEKNLLMFQMTSSWLIVVISVFTISYNFVKFFELTVIKVNFPRLSQNEVLFTSGDFVPTQREWKWQHQRDQWRVNTGKSPSRLLLEEKRRSIKGKVIFRCASISWIHVEESVSQSLSNVFEILSNLGHIFRLSSGYAQGRFKYVQSVFRVCSECVQSVFQVC